MLHTSVENINKKEASTKIEKSFYKIEKVIIPQGQMVLMFIEKILGWKIHFQRNQNTWRQKKSLWDKNKQKRRLSQICNFKNFIGSKNFWLP